MSHCLKSRLLPEDPPAPGIRRHGPSAGTKNVAFILSREKRARFVPSRQGGFILYSSRACPCRQTSSDRLASHMREMRQTYLYGPSTMVSTRKWRAKSEWPRLSKKLSEYGLIQTFLLRLQTILGSQFSTRTPILLAWETQPVCLFADRYEFAGPSLMQLLQSAILSLGAPWTPCANQIPLHAHRLT